MSKPLEFDVAGQIEVDNQIVPNTGDYFTVKIRGRLMTTVKQDRDFVEKLGEAAVMAQIDGTSLIQDMELSDVAEVVASRFEGDDLDLMIETLQRLRGLAIT